MAMIGYYHMIWAVVVYDTGTESDMALLYHLTLNVMMNNHNWFATIVMMEGSSEVLSTSLHTNLSVVYVWEKKKIKMICNNMYR